MRNTQTNDTQLSDHSMRTSVANTQQPEAQHSTGNRQFLSGLPTITAEPEISNQTQHMDPATAHSTRNLDCQSIHSSQSLSFRRRSSQNEDESVRKRLKKETKNFEMLLDISNENNLLKPIRRRNFSHWQHKTNPPAEQMIQAGFFACNVGDRVICIYCNLICQQWTPYADNPIDVHKTFSPNCPYVKKYLSRSQPPPIVNLNLNSMLQCSNEIVSIQTNNPNCEVPKRCQSFKNPQWPKENVPSVDDLVAAGFFYTGENDTVTCFYCNGSLQNWSQNSIPKVEHARWFPHCAYARQCCGNELYRNIQKDIQQQNESTRMNESQQLSTSEESALSQLVDTKLALTISQYLMQNNFESSIVKQCWENQLRTKKCDFEYETDLYIACLILQKQIEYIDGNKGNFIIPSKKMEERMQQLIQEDQERKSKQPGSHKMTSTEYSPSVNGEGEATTNQQAADVDKSNDQSKSSTPSNPCVLCLSEDKTLACIPCGHLITCIPCSQKLSSCPRCRYQIAAFIRIFA